MRAPFLLVDNLAPRLGDIGPHVLGTHVGCPGLTEAIADDGLGDARLIGDLAATIWWMQPGKNGSYADSSDNCEYRRLEAHPLK